MSYPSSAVEYQRQFYIAAQGISREVLTTDICRYLGNNARVVGPDYDPEGNTVGYFYWAYRAFTDEMVRSLQDDTARWRRERRERERAGLAGVGTYEFSQSGRRPTSGDIMPIPGAPTHPTLDNPDTDRFLYDSNGIPVVDRRTGQPVSQLAAGTVGESRDIPRRIVTSAPIPIPGGQAANPTDPAPPPGSYPSGYWTQDFSGRRFFVYDGRIVPQ